MMARGVLVMLALVAGCDGGEEDCLPEERSWQWPDADGDGFGDGEPDWACPATAGLADDAGDCDDDDPDVHPASADLCDGIDNDCDGDIDEGLPTVAWYPDADGDGWGGDGEPVRACGAPGAGWADRVGDCDDTTASTNPGALEVCNDGVDDDCDGLADDDDPSRDESTAPRWYADVDGDTFGDPRNWIAQCTDPGDRVADATDCNDFAAAVNPAATEVCDPGQVDEDCSGQQGDDDPGIDSTTQQTFFADADADGLGDAASPLLACGLPWGAAANDLDCDDSDASIGEPVIWLPDADGDGYGAVVPPMPPSCTPPLPSFVDAARGPDCDDADAAIHPGASEACNGFDDDCDDLVDDLDDWVLPSSATAVWSDADLDGYGVGDPDYVCIVPGDVVLVGGDCDDTDAAISPDATEVCGGVDEDCDGLEGDDDPDVDPSGFVDLWPDLDGDGFGDGLGASTQACVVQPATADNADDCDDSDPLFGLPEPWYADTDADGYGEPPQVGADSCTSTGPGTVPSHLGVDCAPDDPAVSPGAIEICMDGTDQDCNGSDNCLTCGEWLAGDPGATDGPYPLDIGFGPPRDVWCDMTTDGGGWTLVGSAYTGLEDQAGPYHPDLATLEPSQANEDDIWDGLRGVVPVNTDLRFACKEFGTDATMTVDLSFYDVFWYDEITVGTDAQSCFNEGDGAGYDPAPARRDNLAGTYLPAGDDWNTGYLEGEDTCDDESDFTVDFDDRGMDSDEADGTDWGEDDNVMKCGAGLGEAFFLFVREPG